MHCNTCIKSLKKLRTNIEKFILIDKYSSENINYPLDKNVWIKFEKNNQKIAICHRGRRPNISGLLFKNNWKHEEQVIILIISNREGWHYLAVIRVSLL